MLQLGTPPLVAPVNTCFRFAGYGSEQGGARANARELCEIILLNAIVFGLGSFVISRRQITFYGCRNTACRASPVALPPCSPALAREAVAAVAAVATAAAVAAVFQI